MAGFEIGQRSVEDVVALHGAHGDVFLLGLEKAHLGQRQPQRAAALLDQQHGTVVDDAARAQCALGLLQRLLQALQAYGLGQIVHCIELESL